MNRNGIIQKGKSKGFEFNVDKKKSVIEYTWEQAKEYEREKLIAEFLEDLKGINYQMTVKKVRYTNINGTIEKWEAKKNED